jgi:predicted ribosome quality control (RQC) complex YloA/Tae2 family protein
MEGLDNLFTEKLIEKGKEAQTSAVDKKIAELQNQLDEQNNAIVKVKEKSAKITDIAKRLQELVSQGISTIKDPKVTNLLKKNDSEIIQERGVWLLKIHDEKIKINLDSSIHTIASILFNEAKHQMAAISSIEKLKKKTEKNLAIQNKEVKIVEKSITYSEIRKKNWFERYRWFYTTDGILAIGGRDSSSNSAVIRKHLEKNDKVFHADINGSPFFVLKIGTKPVNPGSLREIAHATVCFSRAWREAVYGLNAYWVEPNQVKKAAPSGQFLAKGAFVIDGTRNFVNISTLKLAVGIVKQDTNFLITCGPPNAIIKNSLCYVVIEPTGSEMTDVAKKIKSEFLKINDEVAKNISLDDLVRVLPAGKSHVVDSGIGEQSGE